MLLSPLIVAKLHLTSFCSALPWLIKGQTVRKPMCVVTVGGWLAFSALLLAVLTLQPLRRG